MKGIKVTRMLGRDERVSVQALWREVQINVYSAGDHLSGCTLSISGAALCEMLLMMLAQDPDAPPGFIRELDSIMRANGLVE